MLTFGPDGNLFVSSAATDSVLRYQGSTGAGSGQFIDASAVTSSGGLDAPRELIFGDDENLYVVSKNTNEVLRYGVASQAVLTVSLSMPVGMRLSVDFDTESTPGTAAVGSDYVATSGTVVFEPGLTTRTVIVPTINDDIYEPEPDEVMFVDLFNESAGTIADGQGTVTIQDDDRPRFVVNDVTHDEGDAGSVDWVFTVRRMGELAGVATVDYATIDDTATAGEDYDAASGQLTFADSVDTQTFTVTGHGDTTTELHEVFLVELTDPTGPTGITIADGLGVGTIQNDDGVFLAGTVFADADGDGIQDGHEVGLEDWTVELQLEPAVRIFANPDPGNSGVDGQLEFGIVLASLGDDLIVGHAAWTDEDTNSTASGIAYLLDGATGDVLQTLDNPTPGSWDSFGCSVATMGDKVLIGAYGDDSRGAVYVFDSGTGELDRTFPNPDHSGNGFGVEVAATGNVVVVGAPDDETLGFWTVAPRT